MSRTCAVCQQAPVGQGRSLYCADCTNVERTCETCGESFLVPRAHFRDQRVKGLYCSRLCAGTAKPPPTHWGKTNPRFKGGLSFNGRRWLIMCRDGSQMLFYRGVMAAHIGRLLSSDELVHHINGDPTDDRIENLQIVTRSEHIQLHRRELAIAQAEKYA